MMDFHLVFSYNQQKKGSLLTLFAGWGYQTPSWLLERAMDNCKPLGLLRTSIQSGVAPLENAESGKRLSQLFKANLCGFWFSLGPYFVQGSLKDTFCPFETWLFPPK